MAILMPTPANIRFLKAILMDDFEMGSAHSSEAIAALLGFRTNASYLTGTKGAQYATVYEADFDQFEKRSIRLGYDKSSAEYLRFIFVGLTWPDSIWKLIDKRDYYTKNSWFNQCQLRDIPFLYVSKARKYYSVHWDHVSAGSDYDEHMRRAGEGEIRKALFRAYQLIAAGVDPKSFFEGGAYVGDVTGLSAISARQIANAFALLLFPGNVRSREMIT